VLAVEHISFGYGQSDFLLSDVSFQVNKGDVICILGPNGAGKTSLLKCLLGMAKVRKGTIKIKNLNLQSISARERAKAMAYVPQATTTVFPHKVLDMVLMGCTSHIGFTAAPSLKEERAALEALTELGIAHLVDSMFSQISGGERQLTLIGRALVQKAELLIMDEPTSSLDYGNQVRILKVISRLANQGYSIIMTSHFPNQAFLLCNKVLIMKAGKIKVFGSPDEVMTAEALSELYTTKIHLTEIHVGQDKVKICVPLLA